MELTAIDIELLERYFYSELTGDELSALQKRLQQKDFAEAAGLYLQTLSAIQSAGRTELKSSLTVLRKDIEQKNGFEKYRPAYSGGKNKNSGGSGFMILLIAVIIGVIAWIFLKDKIRMSDLRNVVPDSEQLDTVFHYNIRRDTVYVERKDSLVQPVTRRIKSDTIYDRRRRLDPREKSEK